MNVISLILLLITVRLLSVFVVRTYYVPDEYWQSLEVAHQLTFGYGYLTWEWLQGVRSYVYPLVIAGVYKVLAILNMDTVEMLTIMPRLLQAALSTYSDYRFFIWCDKKKWSLFIIATSWYWFYMASRTLLNTLETSLTTIALSYYPWNRDDFDYLIPAILCCYLRPTAAIVWLPLICYHMMRTRTSLMVFLVENVGLVSLTVLLICGSIDCLLYNRLIITPFEFLKYNIFYNVGSFYGSHPWYWYFTEGVPAILGVNFLPFLVVVVDTIRNWRLYSNYVRRPLLVLILFNLLILSKVEHKEHRFICILLPMCLYVLSDGLTKWSCRASKLNIWCVTTLLVFGNALPAWYLSSVYQIGPITIMDKLNKVVEKYRDERQQPANVLFLMPCHSTPYYSHIHQNITMRILTCEPNFEGNKNYQDEAEKFFNSPMHWLRSHIPFHPRTAKPTHLVMHEFLSMHIRSFLLDYKLLFNVSNTEYMRRGNDDSSSSSNNILLYERLRTGEENLYNQDSYFIELLNAEDRSSGIKMQQAGQESDILEGE